MSVHPGDRLGNYKLIKLLGSGGYAEVYLGEHTYLKKPAAIKVFNAPITEEDTADFLKEARIIADLDHPHIIPILDCGVERYIPFLVMKYAQGGPLHKQYPRGYALPSGSIMNYVTQVADALQYAHDRRIIHRDVKPANMLIGQDDTLYLSDFGIALLAQTTQITQDVIGTLAYMAPEQFAGKPRVASDQYSLAIVVYEWICGERPFQGTAHEIQAQQLSSSPPSLKKKVPEIPNAVERVVFKALEKDPKNRFDNIQAFADALIGAYGSLNSQMIQPYSKSANEQISFGNQLNPLPPQKKASVAYNSIPNLSPLTHQAAYPPMEELQPKPVPGKMVAHPTHSTEVEAQQREALAIKYAIGKLNDYLGWFLVVLETALVIRFFLKLIGADPRNLFAGFLYALTDILLLPFINIVGSASFHQNQYFEFPTLLAISVYYLIFWALKRFLRVLISNPEEPTS